MILVFGLWSSNYQRGIWIASSTIAKVCIDKFGRSYLKHSDKSVEYLVDDVPFVFVEGPFILKCYAFKFYFQKPAMKVKAKARTLAYNNGNLRTVAYFEDPHSDDIEIQEAIIIDTRQKYDDLCDIMLLDLISQTIGGVWSERSFRSTKKTSAGLSAKPFARAFP